MEFNGGRLLLAFWEQYDCSAQFALRHLELVVLKEETKRVDVALEG